MRFKFGQDQSCHWYMLPESLWAKWDEMAANDISDDDYCVMEAFERLFAAHRLNGGPERLSFTDPKEIP